MRQKFSIRINITYLGLVQANSVFGDVPCFACRALKTSPPYFEKYKNKGVGGSSISDVLFL